MQHLFARVCHWRRPGHDFAIGIASLKIVRHFDRIFMSLLSSWHVFATEISSQMIQTKFCVIFRFFIHFRILSFLCFRASAVVSCFNDKQTSTSLAPVASSAMPRQMMFVTLYVCMLIYNTRKPNIEKNRIKKLTCAIATIMLSFVSCDLQGISQSQVVLLN